MMLLLGIWVGKVVLAATGFGLLLGWLTADTRALQQQLAEAKAARRRPF